MSLLETLRCVADDNQEYIKPLPIHALAEIDETLRQKYVHVLAAVLAAQNAVSGPQSLLLRLLLESLGLRDSRSALFMAVREWDDVQLTEVLKLMRENDVVRTLLVDALVLLRVDGPLSEPMIRMVTDLAMALGLNESDLVGLVDCALAVLGLCESKYGDLEQFSELAAEFWPGCPPQEKLDWLEMKNEWSKVRSEIESMWAKCRTEFDRIHEENIWLEHESERLKKLILGLDK